MSVESLDFNTLLKTFTMERRTIVNKSTIGSRQYKTEADTKYETTEYKLAIELYTKAIECHRMISRRGLAQSTAIAVLAFYGAIRGCHQGLRASAQDGPE